jgi:hypothetical protein
VLLNTDAADGLLQAEHHARALKHLPGVKFYQDEKRGRVGMLTTQQVKHAMCTLLNAMLR